MKRSLNWIFLIGAFGMSLALITKPRTKYLREGDNGTIAACFEFTLTPVFRSDIRWYQINATATTQIPNRNMHSEVWSTGYILKATNVKSKNSGNYCCLVGEMETCTENATTQLVVAVTPQLTIHDSVMIATHGESVLITCDHSNPDAIPIRMRWYKNGTLLYTGEKYTIGVQTHSYTLHIHNVTENDEGAYNCIADSAHSAQSIGTIHLTVMSATTSSLASVTTTASSSNPTTEQPSRNTANQNITASMLMTLVIFPSDMRCELSKLITVDDDLQVYLMNLCNCTNITIHSVSFECINDSMASYSFFIAGERALEVATVFNHSLNNQEHLTTINGISFSLHSPLQNNSTPSISTVDEDSDTIHLNTLFSVLIAIFAVGIILMVGLSVGMCICLKKSKDAELKKNLNLNNHHAYENLPRRPINYATAV